MKFVAILFLIGLHSPIFGQTIWTDQRREHLENLLDTTKGVLTSKDLQDFWSTDYFAIDSNYVIEAQFVLDKGRRFKMPTSTDRQPIYRRYGFLNFSIQGKQLRLTVYQNVELSKKKGFENYLFIPLRDSTTALSTYGAGRYLDFKIPSTEKVKLDFNLLYNPYCAYSYRYSCPIPPAENTLPVAITAGEKTPIYKEDH